MDVTYYALSPIEVGGEIRKPGQLIPEAHLWKHRGIHIRDGKIAPVLVVTLPQNTQDQLAEWEMAQLEIQLELESANAVVSEEVTEEEKTEEEPAKEPETKTTTRKPRAKSTQKANT